MHKPVIGVLALQGAVQPHRPHIEAAGASFLAVKTPEQFRQVDAFILPGGESTTMLKLIDTFDLWDELAWQFKAKPVWGICAGAILIAETVFSSPRKRGPSAQEQDPRFRGEGKMESEQKSFGLIPMTIERNAYGRQIDSHHADIQGYEVSFIRAPVIKNFAKVVTVKAQHEGDPVWLEYGQYMATSFHPELTLNYPSPMHRVFIDMAKHHSIKMAA